MTAILSALPWRWIGLGAAVLGAWLYVSHLRTALADREATISEQRAQLDQIQAANATLSSSLDELKADHVRQIAALSESAATAQKRAAQTRQQIEAIRNAPTSDDGPVAPILGRTLDGLRRAGTEGSDSKQGRALISP